MLSIQKENKKIILSILCTVSLLNIWFLPELFLYAEVKGIPISLSVLTGPDYLSLESIPLQLQELAKQKINFIKGKISDSQYQYMMNMLNRNDNEYLFLHALRHILLLDSLRNENLFDILPFRNLAIELTAKNHEFE